MRPAFLLLAVAVLGCSRDPTEAPAYGRDPAVRSEGVTYRAETQVLESFPVQLRTLVTITNATTGPVTLTMPDGCIVLLRAYADANATRPVFDQATVRACTMALQDVRLAAGQSVLFEARSDAREVLGERLPDGRYWLRAVLRPNGRVVEVPAGVVELAVPR